MIENDEQGADSPVGQVEYCVIVKLPYPKGAVHHREIMREHLNGISSANDGSLGDGGNGGYDDHQFIKDEPEREVQCNDGNWDNDKKRHDDNHSNNQSNHSNQSNHEGDEVESGEESFSLDDVTASVLRNAVRDIMTTSQSFSSLVDTEEDIQLTPPSLSPSVAISPAKPFAHSGTFGKEGQEEELSDEQQKLECTSVSSFSGVSTASSAGESTLSSPLTKC